MQSAKEAREARRKRILERGSDRLAYITGDTKNSLKPAHSSHSSAKEETSTIALDQADRFDRGFEDQGVEQEAFELPARFTESAGDDIQPTTARPVITTVSTAQPSDTIPAFVSGSSNISARRTDVVNVGKKLHSAHVRRLVQSIDASEGMRALMAVIVAIAIVSQTLLSCCGYPWGSALSVWLPRWPISLIFLTDFSMVIWAFIIRSHHNYSQKEMSSNESQGLDGSFEKFSKPLDFVGHFEDLFNIGMLCKKAASAISLDCSIYAVTIVCGLSLGQYGFSCCSDI